MSPGQGLEGPEFPPRDKGSCEHRNAKLLEEPLGHLTPEPNQSRILPAVLVHPHEGDKLLTLYRAFPYLEQFELVLLPPGTKFLVS